VAIVLALDPALPAAPLVNFVQYDECGMGWPAGRSEQLPVLAAIPTRTRENIQVDAEGVAGTIMA